MPIDPNQTAEEAAVDAGLANRPVTVSQLSTTIKTALGFAFASIVAVAGTVAALQTQVASTGTDASKLTVGILRVAQGGTGASALPAGLLKGSGNALIAATADTDYLTASGPGGNLMVLGRAEAAFRADEINAADAPFSLVCDGSTIETAQWKALAAAAAFRTSVLLPKGDCRIDDTIAFNGVQISLRGRGHGSTTVTQTAANKDAIWFPSTNGNYLNEVNDLRIMSVVSNASGAGLRLDKPSQFHSRNLNILDFYTNLALAGAQDTHFQGFTSTSGDYWTGVVAGSSGVSVTPGADGLNSSGVYFNGLHDRRCGRLSECRHGGVYLRRRRALLHGRRALRH